MQYIAREENRRVKESRWPISREAPYVNSDGNADGDAVGMLLVLGGRKF